MRTQYFIILASFSTLASSSNDCHACIENVCYSHTPILDGYRFSGQLAVDRTENIVYFHYEDSQSIDYTAAFDLDDIRFKIIPSIGFSFARAVDQSNRDVYIGSARGIYKYNPKTNTTKQVGLFDKTILQMQFKNKIYYTVLNTKGLFTFENKQSRSVAQLSNYIIDDFIIDKRADIYFVSQSKLYRLKKGANQVTVIADDIYSLSIDKFENAHFVHSGKRGLYKLDDNDEFIEVGAFGGGVPLKAAFDNNNNILYHENNSKKLYCLMPNYGRCVVSRRAYAKARPQEIGTDDNELLIHRIDRRFLKDAA